MANPRKSSHLKLIEGTARKDRTNPAEPRPTSSAPIAPRHLLKEARRAWTGYAALLMQIDVLTVADGAALESCAETYAELVHLRATLTARGSAHSLGY